MINSTTNLSAVPDKPLAFEDVRVVGLGSVPAIPSYEQSAGLTETGSVSLDVANSIQALPSRGVRPVGIKQAQKKQNPKQKKRGDARESGTPAAYITFRRTCDEIVAQARELESLVLADGALAEGWEGPAIEIRALLLSMREIPW